MNIRYPIYEGVYRILTSEQPAYNPKDYEDYIDFPQSMLEPKYSPYQTR